MAKRRIGIEEYYSIPESAIILNVSRQCTWKWVRDKRLPASRVGGVWLIHPDECRHPELLKRGPKKKRKRK